MELKPDIEQVLERFEAWWACAVVDRPLVSIHFSKPADERVADPASTHVSHRDRWLDTSYQVDLAVTRLTNTVHYADALPIAWPNLGPEVFSSFYGCPLTFGESTSWTSPILASLDDDDVRALRLDRDSPYFEKLVEMTDALIEAGRGRFLVGYTDLHTGGDAVAAFRDPQALCIDVLERPEAIARLCERVTDDFFGVYDFFHERLKSAGMTSTTWLGGTCRGRYHVPSNDFSCMISPAHFERIFYPALVRECRHMDRSIYHVDGPNALRHLDLILQTPEIHAVQWVGGAGRDDWKKWIDVYRRIQAAGKAFWIPVPARDIDLLMETLKPEGAWVAVRGVADEAAAEETVKKISRWGKKK